MDDKSRELIRLVRGDPDWARAVLNTVPGLMDELAGNVGYKRTTVYKVRRFGIIKPNEWAYVSGRGDGAYNADPEKARIFSTPAMVKGWIQACVSTVDASKFEVVMIEILSKEIGVGKVRPKAFHDSHGVEVDL
jgi:hypothetical protein